LKLVKTKKGKRKRKHEGMTKQLITVKRRMLNNLRDVEEWPELAELLRDLGLVA